MTDRIRRISKIIVCAIVALLFSTCFVACGEPEPIADFGYVATKMNITATVNADCTVDIVEEMTVHYIESSRGWLRYLPCNSGEQYRNVKAEGDEYEMSHDGDFLVIRFGEEDWWYKEGVEADYRIEYTVVLPDLDSDVFEYNIVGTDYDMIRAGVTLTLNFPAPIESENVYFGEKGSTQTDNERLNKTVSEDKKQIVLTVNEYEMSLPSSDETVRVGLLPFEGVTVKAAFGAGTFGKPLDGFAVGAAIVGAILTVLAVLAKFLYSRQDTPIATVNFYPPKGEGNRQLSPAQAGMLIDNVCSSEDVTSLLFFWASKGCIEIADEDGDTKLIYKSELDNGAPSYEKDMFEKLFRRAKEDEESGEKYVMLSSLNNRFYGTVSQVQSAVTGEYKNRMYSKSHSAASLALALLAAVYVFGVTTVAYWGISAGWFNFFPLAMGIPCIFAVGLGATVCNNKFKLKAANRAGLLLLLALLVGGSTAACMFLIPSNALNLTTKIIVGVCFALTVFSAALVSKRTKFYNDKLGELIGFRDFLKYAEKDKLEMLLKDNPQYYYDILPYANALGVSKIWQDKFEGLTLAPPRYYRMGAGDVFTILIFNDMYRRTHTRCRNTMTSRPQASSSLGRSGGGFGGGGGGFSGGGFGGGGSRRW